MEYSPADKKKCKLGDRNQAKRLLQAKKSRVA
jgi:hypothetical protein